MTDFMTMKYNVDMVFCIDATGSMSPVLETVKQNALNFYDDVTKVMNEKQKSIDRLRIRVIAFRDYLADGDRAMFATNFFDLPAQAREFETCIKSISAKGGGDEPEDALEALAYAIKIRLEQRRNKKKECHCCVDGRFNP